MPIHILPQEVASKIAAGEVVDRPASVVKELIENSLDAGATQISIIIEGGGKGLIEVSDNGTGIPSGEVSIAIERFSTSKIFNAEDLFHVSTLGFRGEALASIGSIARLSLTTRTHLEDIGSNIRVEGGRMDPPKPTGAPIGTVVRVQDLFFNVPARRKFLKHENTERRMIDALVTRYALAYPKVRFHLQQEGKDSIQTSGNGNGREVLATLYGVEMARQILEVTFEEEEISIAGFISSISLTRSNRKEIIIFVNGRPVQDSSLATAIIQAYHAYLMVGRFPIVFLFLKLLPEEVDVNVHPTKAEVKFHDPNRVFTDVQRAVRRTLIAHTPVPEVNNLRAWGSHHDKEGNQGQAHRYGNKFTGDERASLLTSPDAFSGKDQQSKLPFTHPGLPILRLIGQVAATYLIAEGPDGLYLIDQHAAHERILFEQMMDSREKNNHSQSLIQPIPVALPPAQVRLLIEQLPILERMGFKVELFGRDTFLVRGMPFQLTHLDPEAALRVIVDNFEEDETPFHSELEARLVARICKRAAIKAGQVLTEKEQQTLIKNLEHCKSPRTCPHGRPTMILLPVDLLERQFGRRGAL